MDAAPKEELDMLNKQLGLIFAQYKTTKKRYKKKKLIAEAYQTMAIRNRYVFFTW